jgi:hypothetical protein
VKIIEHTIDIPAPIEAVWNVLIDVHTYAEWNPFLNILTVPEAIGDQLTVTVRPGTRKMTFRPTVTAFTPGREISWLGRLLLPGIFDGAHTLALEPLGHNLTRFRHREVFRGVLVPMMRSVLRDTDSGFAAMNEALVTRLQTLVSESSH